MTASVDVRTAILDQLRALNADVSTPIDLYAIGVPLIAAGYGQHEIANALYTLDSDKVISLIGANRLQMIRPL